MLELRNLALELGMTATSPASQSIQGVYDIDTYIVDLILVMARISMLATALGH